MWFRVKFVLIVYIRLWVLKNRKLFFKKIWKVYFGNCDVCWVKNGMVVGRNVLNWWFM